MGRYVSTVALCHSMERSLWLFTSSSHRVSDNIFFLDTSEPLADDVPSGPLWLREVSWVLVADLGTSCCLHNLVHSLWCLPLSVHELVFSDIEFCGCHSVLSLAIFTFLQIIFLLSSACYPGQVLPVAVQGGNSGDLEASGGIQVWHPINGAANTELLRLKTKLRRDAGSSERLRDKLANVGCGQAWTGPMGGWAVWIFCKRWCALEVLLGLNTSKHHLDMHDQKPTDIRN